MLAKTGETIKRNYGSDRDQCRRQLVSILAFSIMAVLLFADHAYAYDESRYISVCKKAMDYLEGDFGALLTAMAGMGAIVASAVGGFKVAWALLVVALGAFILRNFIIGADDVGFFAGKC